MPNWSRNYLTISGTRNDMLDLYKHLLKIKDGIEVFKFSNVFPMPDKIKNTISPSSSAIGRKFMNVDTNKARSTKIDQILDGESKDDVNLISVENNTLEKCVELKKEFGVDNWYDWNVSNYGTKWDIEVRSGEYTKSDTCFVCEFDTAWSPPFNFIDRLQIKFPKIDIELIWDIEGYDDCGRLYTKRSEDGVTFHFEESKLVYRTSEGEEIKYTENGWVYVETGNPCGDDVFDNSIAENPFRGN